MINKAFFNRYFSDSYHFIWLLTLAILVFAILKSQETIGQVGVRAREQSLSPKHLKEIFKSLQIDNGDASLTPEKFNNFLSLNADLISHSRFTEARTFLEDRLKAVNKGNPIDYNKQVSILMKLGEIEMRAGEFKKSRSLFLRACHAAQVQGLKNEAVTALEFLFETTRAGHKFAETEEEKLFWIKDFNDNLQILETLDSQGISDIYQRTGLKNRVKLCLIEFDRFLEVDECQSGLN